MTSDSRSAFEPLSSDAVIDWCSASTFPAAALGVPPVPPALPTPVTAAPTFTVLESPKLATVRPEAFVRWTTAMSSVGSVPTTLAVYVAPVETTVTLIEVAPSTTWLLVRTSPFESSTMPVPAACASWYPSVVSMSTTPADCVFEADGRVLVPELPDPLPDPPKP